MKKFLSLFVVLFVATVCMAQMSYLPPRGMYKHWNPETNKGNGYSVMYVPGMTDFTFTNTSAVKEGNLWHFNYLDADAANNSYRDLTEYADADGNYTTSISFGKYLAAPTLVNAEQTDSFALSMFNSYWTQEKYAHYFTRLRVSSMDWCGPVDDHMRDSAGKSLFTYGYMTATSNQYLWGSGKYAYKHTDSEGAEVVDSCLIDSLVQVYPKPVTPFYAEKLYVDIVTANVGIPAIGVGQKVYLDIINNETDEVVATLEASEEDVQRDTNSDGSVKVTSTGNPKRNWNTGVVYFSAKETDAFGNVVTVPFVIDCEYRIKIYGLNEEGTSIGFYKYTFQTQDGMTLKQDEGNCYYTTPEGVVRAYYHSNKILSVGFYGMFDVAKVRTEASFYVDDTQTETQIIGDLNKFTISTDGTKCSNGAQSYAVVYTALPWFEVDEAGVATGNENYYILDENYECPDWLTIDIDDSSYSSNYYSKVKFTATALPEGVASRSVTLYASSEKGALAADPIIITQGEEDTAIKEATVMVETGCADKVFNLMGQKVSCAQNGLYIINGKKVILK